jgi:hypothetical protein
VDGATDGDAPLDAAGLLGAGDVVPEHATRTRLAAVVTAASRNDFLDNLTFASSTRSSSAESGPGRM